MLGVTGGLLTHNVFAYCGNNPVMYSDPSGMYWDPILGVEITTVDNDPEDIDNIIDDILQDMLEEMYVEGSAITIGEPKTYTGIDEGKKEGIENTLKGASKLLKYVPIYGNALSGFIDHFVLPAIPDAGISNVYRVNVLMMAGNDIYYSTITVEVFDNGKHKVQVNPELTIEK